MNIDKIIDSPILSDIVQEEEETELIGLATENCPHCALQQYFYLRAEDVGLEPRSYCLGIPFISQWTIVCILF